MDMPGPGVFAYTDIFILLCLIMYDINLILKNNIEKTQ